MPLGTAEGRDYPQALEYLKAEGRTRSVSLADVEREMAIVEEEADSLETCRILDQMRDALAGFGETATVREVGLRLDDVIAARGDHAVVDVAALVATRLLKYVRGPGQEREVGQQTQDQETRDQEIQG